jgi:hypothetical protein
VCALSFLPAMATSGTLSSAQEQAPAQGAAQQQEAPKIPADQLDSLVAPIALYPDPLLAQVLAASTYPLELIQLGQWLEKHKDLKDKALTDAVQKENWDPSVQAMAPLPDVVKRLTDDVQWTTDLGNAFLAQQSDVMDAVQRMRVKAKEKGNLKSSDEMKVETKVVENKSVVVIEQSKPDVIYVPSYNPTVVYGAPVYPYPPVAYPPPGYYAAGMAISFGVGMAMGAAWGGGWGYNCGWGGNNNVTINNNNTFVNNSNRNVNANRQNLNANRQNVNAGNRTGNNWQHNPQHRGGTPYANRATANQYGGTARGDSMAARQANARQAGTADRGSMDRGSVDRGSRQPANAGDRAGAGGDRVGNRTVSPSSGNGARSSAFSDASRGASGAKASSSRGASSMRSRGGGGRRR